MIAYLCAIGIVALIYALLALGLNLQFGLTRLVNFGVVAFFALGAYTSGLLSLQGCATTIWPSSRWVSRRPCASPSSRRSG
jgi:ABC-type branched-subunit amino acid transport system permease subunit